MKFRNIFLSFVLAFCVIATSFMFVGCGKNYTYDELEKSYVEMVNTYDDFFDENNFVKITYNSANLNNEINLLGNKEQNFTKLSNDLDNPEAVYEPVLRASLMMPSTFLIGSGNIGVEIPQDKLNNAYQSLDKLKNCFASLNNQKTTFLEFYANSDDFNPADSNIQMYLKNYCEELNKTIKASCDFDLLFEEIYINYIFEEDSIIRPGALTTGAVKFEYLTKISEFSRIYQEFQLSSVHKQIINGPQKAGEPIELEEPNICSKMLLDYEEIKDSKMEGSVTDTITEQEQDIIDAYKQLALYNPIYKVNYENALKAVKKYDIATLNKVSSDQKLTIEQEICLKKINEFLNTDCENILAYMNTIQKYVKIYNGI